MAGQWRLLGIDPTTDRRAIRSAYATRLKAMDVDADPQGFARLRAARDAALAWEDRGAEDDDGDDAFDGNGFDDDPEPPTHHEPLAAHTPVDPGQQALVDAVDAHYRALVALLFADGLPTPAEVDAIAHHGAALLADPRMEEVDFATSAEQWYADNLAASIPRSDPLLEPAAAQFGWIARRDDYALSPAAREIVDRIGATRYVTLLDDPGHRLHRAWHDLTHADGRKLKNRSDVSEVMTTVRERYPLAEGWMDADRVAAWDATRAKANHGPGRLTVWIIIAVVVLIRVAVMQFHDDPVVPPAMMPTADAAAQMLTGRSAADVAAINPPLAAMIDRAVVPSMGTTSPEPVFRAIADLGDRQTIAGLRDAPDDLVRNLARWEVDAMAARRSTDPAACVGIHIAADANGLSQSLRDRQRGLIRQVILYSRETPVDTAQSRFTVPAALLETVAERSGFDSAQVRRAFHADASDADRCAVDIALRQAALDAPPKQGNPVLRDMQPLLNE